MPARHTLDNITPDDYADLLRVHRGEITLGEYRRKYRRGHEASRRLLDELGGLAAGDAPGPTVVPDAVVDELDDPEEDIDRLWRKAASYQREVNRRATIPFDYTVDLDTNLPILLCWIADMHIGDARSNLDLIEKSLKTIRDTPGMYAIFGGDDGENTTSSRAGHGAHHHRIMKTKTERRFIERALTWTGHDESGRPKTLGVGEGNHTGRSIQDDGDSWLEHLCIANGLHYYGYRQRFNLNVGHFTYRILCAHKHRGGGLDKTRPAKKLMEDWGEADLVFTAHKHDIAASQEFIRLEPRGFAQAGSFKDFDDFSDSRGYTPSMPYMPGAILWPDRRRFDLLFNVFDSVGMFTREREHYQRQLEAKAA